MVAETNVAEQPHIIEPKAEKALLREHPGEWAALSDDGSVVAVSESAVEAYQQAQERGTEVPTMYYVPDEETRHFYY